MKRTDLGQLTETNCLTIAADLEGAIIEKKFFETLSSLGTKFTLRKSKGSQQQVQFRFVVARSEATKQSLGIVSQGSQSRRESIYSVGISARLVRHNPDGQ